MKSVENRRRQKDGYALVSVLAIGVASMLLLMTLASTLISIVRSEAMEKNKNQLRSAAEVGLNYAIHRMNAEYRGLDNGLSEPPIVPSEGQAYLDSSLPSSLIPSTSSGLSVRIRVSRVNDSMMETIREKSAFYNPSYDPKHSSSTPEFGHLPKSPWSGASGDNNLMIVDATAHRGIFHSSVRAFVGKKLSQTDGPTPYFTQSVVANSSFSMGKSGSPIISPSGTLATSGDFNLTIQSNGTANLGMKGQLRGNLQVSNPKSGAPPNVVTAAPGSKTTIWGRVTANSGVDTSSLSSRTGTGLPIFPTLVDIYTNDSVKALGDLYSGDFSKGRQGANQNPISKGLSQSFSMTVPAPSTPSSASPLPNFPKADPAGSETQVSPVDLAPGVYSSRAIDSTNAGAEISLSGGESTTLYLTEDSLDSAMKISSDLFQTDKVDPTKFQIYYDGNKPISIELKNNMPFNGLIYAPNADVSVTGQGDFAGAIVGNNVEIENSGNVTLINDVTKSGRGPGYTEDSAGEPLFGDSAKGAYQVLSWTSTSVKLVP